MKKIFSIFFFLVFGFAVNLFAQKTDGTPPPPPPAPGDTSVKRSNPDTSCFAIEKKDTTWNSGCKSIQQIAEFPGGDGALYKFLSKNVYYPQQAKEIGLQGKVFLSFVIDKNGDVIDVTLYKGMRVPTSINGKYLTEEEIAVYKTAAKAMDDESLRVVKMMPKWSPAKLDNKPVKIRFILPISYKLS